MPLQLLTPRARGACGEALPLLAAVLLAAAVLAGPACQKAALNLPPSGSLGVSADPLSIPATGGVSTVRAVARLPTGELVPDGVVVNFFTTLGTIDPARATTLGGVATATLRSDGTSGTATVSALSGTAPVATVDVSVGAASERLTLSFDPAALPTGGGSARVTVRVTDPEGRPLAGRAVTLAATSPGTLFSSGRALATSSEGVVLDTVTTTATTTVTATLAGSSASGSATLPVVTTGAALLTLFSERRSDGSFDIRVYASDAGAGPVAGLDVTFTTNAGTIAPATARTGANGFAGAVLTTTSNATVTARAGSLSATLQVSVAAPPAAYRIALSARRAGVSDATIGALCAGANPQLPVEVIARVTDTAGAVAAGRPVTVSVQSSTSAFGGRGGFCASSASATADCCGVGSCPAPPPQPTPQPTPLACDCSSAAALPKSASGTTDASGEVIFQFSFEERDLCECLFARTTCRTTLSASGASASGTNTVTIEFTP